MFINALMIACGSHWQLAWNLPTVLRWHRVFHRRSRIVLACFFFVSDSFFSLIWPSLRTIERERERCLWRTAAFSSLPHSRALVRTTECWQSWIIDLLPCHRQMIDRKENTSNSLARSRKKQDWHEEKQMNVEEINRRTRNVRTFSPKWERKFSHLFACWWIAYLRAFKRFPVLIRTLFFVLFQKR